VDLYEHPFQTEQVALTGVASLAEYAERQALVAVIEGRTSDILDQYRQEHLDEEAANHDLYAARATADRRRADVQAEAQRLQSAQLAADLAHAALQKRIADLQYETQDLARQEAALEAQLAANEALVGGFTGSSGRLVWPVHGPVTREFGNQPGGFHPGIDIAPPFGTPIHASAGGVVVYASWEDGYGNYTCINHGGGIATCYAHQSQIGVTVGESVRQGQIIGLEGSTGHSTGPHVHFEVRVNNVPNNPRHFIGGNP
jgi:murein DD-endopeptidase MepM/ murein hydrolase activator NlpD